MGNALKLLVILSTWLVPFAFSHAQTSTDVETFRESLRELGLNRTQKLTLGTVYSNLRHELPKQAQTWMDAVVEGLRNEPIPGLESQVIKASGEKSTLRLSFKNLGREIVIDIDMSSQLSLPLAVNGKTVPSKSWWAEKDFHEFVAGLNQGRSKAYAPTSKMKTLAQIFESQFLIPAMASSLEEKARAQACKKMPVPKVCSDANPVFAAKLRVERARLENALPPVETFSIVAHKPAMVHESNKAFLLATFVGMAVVWKAFYKTASTNGSSLAEAPVPLPLGSRTPAGGSQ